MNCIGDGKVCRCDFGLEHSNGSQGEVFYRAVDARIERVFVIYTGNGIAMELDSEPTAYC